MHIALIIAWAIFATGDDDSLSKRMNVGEMRSAFSPDGKILVACDAQEGLTIWDVRTRKAKKHLKAREQIVSVAFSPDGKTLAAGSVYGDINLWNINEINNESRILHSYKLPHEKSKALGVCHSIAFSPDGRTLASGLSDALNLWDVASGEIRIRLARRQVFQDSVVFSPGGEMLATVVTRTELNRIDSVINGTEKLKIDYCVNIYDSKNGNLLKEISIDAIRVTSLAFSRNGEILLVGGASPSLLLIEASTGKVRLRISEGRAGFDAIAISRDGRFLACAGALKLSLHDANSGRMIRQIGLTDAEDNRDFVPIPHGISSIAFSPDGRTLAILARDKEAPLSLWDVEEKFDVVIEM